MVVSVTFVQFQRNKYFYALSQMGLLPRKLSIVSGLSFFKLMGSGAGNGFSIWPDWSTYCLLGVWDKAQDAHSFFDTNLHWQKYCEKGTITHHLTLKPTKTRGTWNGMNPFENHCVESNGGMIAVLTRATIKKRFVPYFWSQVPQASRAVSDTPGHIFSKGVGEAPLFLQATFSLWQSREDMYAYAYQNQDHIDMIRKTRDKGWYREESFTEFSVLDSSM